jgi:subtilisin family serine protease
MSAWWRSGLGVAGPWLLAGTIAFACIPSSALALTPIPLRQYVVRFDDAFRRFPTLNLPQQDSIPPSKIAPDLVQAIESAPPDQHFSILVDMVHQFTEQDRVALFDSIPVISNPDTLRVTRREALVNTLQAFAGTDQAAVRDSLHAWAPRGVVQRIRPLWIVNVVSVQAVPWAIQRLAMFPEVAGIYSDSARAVAGGTPTWGVGKVGAPDAWTAGVTGKGALVAVLDFGVDFSHHDLKDSWTNEPERRGRRDVDDDGNGYIDDEKGWNFEADDNEPKDELGHGTFIAGIIAGDGTAGEATGVAPDATIMNLKCDSVGGLVTQGDAWRGIEYATVKDARVINFSMGWLYSADATATRWRDVVDVLAAAGILFVTITHNDGDRKFSPPYSIRTPGRVPLALTVGATDRSDLAYVDNNTGPVTWQHDLGADYPYLPGLIKPDLVAPGVDVRSAKLPKPPNQYDTWSGTSFAAAYASGAAALLLEKDPTILGHEMKHLLEENADRTGSTTPNNEFGWGRLNAARAVAGGIDDTPYDLVITGTSELWTTPDIWVDNDGDGTEDAPTASSVNVLYARVRNRGGMVLANTEVRFYCYPASTAGMGDFDPNGDGDPSDGSFTYVGSYLVPTLGPGRSGHAEAVAAVNWILPDPTIPEWCIGVGVVGENSIISYPEQDRTNNVAIRNAFLVETSTAVVPIRLMPPRGASKGPFAVEILRENVPESIQVELVLDSSVAKGLQLTGGLREVRSSVLEGRNGPRSEAFKRAVRAEQPFVCYSVLGERNVIRQLKSARGEPVPAKLIIRSKAKLAEDPSRRIRLNTLNAAGKATGGVTLQLVDRR